MHSRRFCEYLEWFQYKLKDSLDRKNGQVLLGTQSPGTDGGFPGVQMYLSGADPSIMFATQTADN